ncbi:MAG: NAD(P)-dependent oxidoreductase [Bacilli bacterium]|nr:NAD(P)-dependent oxidoreductase [Bacilli bacterium]
MKKKIMILGGTGFLGYYTAKLALERGYEVASDSLDDINLEGWYPKEIKTSFIDVFKASEDELVELMKGYDYMIYSIGPDDRYTPPAPAYHFFHDNLVDNCAKAFRAAEKAGVKKSVVFNSYFAYFDRRYPEMELAKKHLYIRCRVEQAKLLNEQKKNMEVVVLEFPYIFGKMPERMPIWKDVFLDRYVNGKKTVFFSKGGTTMISVTHIAEAALGALEYGKDGERYPVGDQNKSFKWMLEQMSKYACKKKKKICTPPTFLCVMGAKAIDKNHKKQGLEPGLDYVEVMRNIMSRDMSIEPEVLDKVCEELHIGRGGLEESIKDTMDRCYPGMSMK